MRQIEVRSARQGAHEPVDPILRRRVLRQRQPIIPCGCGRTFCTPASSFSNEPTTFARYRSRNAASSASGSTVSVAGRRTVSPGTRPHSIGLPVRRSFEKPKNGGDGERARTGAIDGSGATASNDVGGAAAEASRARALPLRFFVSSSDESDSSAELSLLDESPSDSSASTG